MATTIAQLLLVAALAALVTFGAPTTEPPATLGGREPIPVVNPKRLPATIEVLDRTPLGILGDFKPDIVLCKNGDLLVISGTCAGGLSGHDPPSYSAKNTSLGYCSGKKANWVHNAVWRSKGEPAAER